jgi:hypothetical protein
MAGLVLAAAFFSVSCSQRLGWGILLWATEDPSIPSGTILPVYIRSNIDHVWVAGIPEAYRDGKNGIDKMEIPLSRLELVGSKKKAADRSAQFSQYALTYAETLQDGLPIREDPDNNSRRVYRLKAGEIVKILSLAKGNPAISTTGEPLPGEWYRVLTENGSEGYCFSYRLKLFEHSTGPLAAVQADSVAEEDPDLERLLEKEWSPEIYGTMVNNGRVSLEDFSRHWGFFPGQETGTARIFVSGLDRTFTYTSIQSAGKDAWRFEGSSLQMNLRSARTLAVQFIEENGASRTLLFVALNTAVDDIIIQETARREGLFAAIYSQGPVFTSNNYGTLAFGGDGSFTWTGNNLLVPQVIPAQAAGRGTIAMDIFLGSALRDRYNGAFTLNFETISGDGAPVRFMYTLDSQGFRIEHAVNANIEGGEVNRRASSPMVLYFFKAGM